jgi:hypothetical protein
MGRRQKDGLSPETNVFDQPVTMPVGKHVLTASNTIATKYVVHEAL